jgi:hypothetical protein
MSVLIFIGVSTLCAHFSAMAVGRFGLEVSVLSLVVGVVAAWALRKSSPSLPVIPRSGWVLLAAGYAMLFKYFTYLFYASRSSYLTFNANNLGDLPLHITYIKNFLSQDSYPISNPFFAGEPLLYPIGLDLHNALYEALGIPLSAHLLVVTAVLVWIAGALTYRLAGWLGVIAVFLNGGVLGWYWLARGEPLPVVWGWKNFFTSLWMTQRGLLWALPVGLLTLHQVRGVLRDHREFPWSLVVLIGALPLFHLHSFFFLCVLMFLVLLVRPETWRSFVRLLAIVPTSIYFLWRSTAGLSKASVIHSHWGWVDQGGSSLIFWLWNLGPWLLVVGWLGYIAFRKKIDRGDRQLLAIFVGLFVLFNWLMFAPWDWDNIKLLFWAYLGVVIIAADYWQWLPLPSSMRTLCLAVLATCGITGLIHQGYWNLSGVELYARKDVNAVEAALSEIPQGRVFAAKPTFNHPLSLFGQQLTVGYPGHLWSHGINGRERLRLLRRIMTGQSDWRTLSQELGIDYIYWSHLERSYFSSSDPIWRQQLTNISPVQGIEIYEVPAAVD